MCVEGDIEVQAVVATKAAATHGLYNFTLVCTTMYTHMQPESFSTTAVPADKQPKQYTGNVRPTSDLYLYGNYSTHAAAASGHLDSASTTGLCRRFCVWHVHASLC